MKMQVYVINDLGVEQLSLPMFAPTHVGARRQFVAALRTLPPSARADYTLEHIGEYDTETGYMLSSQRSLISAGNDASITSAIAEDFHFYAPKIDDFETKESEVK